jgi:hypothetical protein
MKEAMKAGALRATKAVDLERNGLRVGRGKWNRNLCIKYFKTMPRQMLED